MKILNREVNIPKWLLWTVTIFFILLLAGIGAFFTWENYYQNKIFTGVKVGSIELGGKTPEEAEKLLLQEIRNIKQNGVPFSLQGKDISINPTISSFSGDFAYQIIEFQTEETLVEALHFGRDRDFFTNIKNRFSALLEPKYFHLGINLREEEIKEIIKNNFKDKEDPTRDAYLDKVESDDDIEFTIISEEYGRSIDYQKAINDLDYNLKNLDRSTISLSLKKTEPNIYKKDCQGLKEEANKIISQAPLKLLTPIEEGDNSSREWLVNKSQLASWLKLKKEKEEVVIGLNQEKIKDFLKEVISPHVDLEPKEAKFEIEGGKVVEFEPSEDGIKLNIEENAEKIERDFISNISGTSTPIKLKVETVKSQVRNENIDDLGIEEIIGTGHSDFSGSPSNRVHNIWVGAESVSGQLIEPEEEFSLVEVLGEINRESGYKPELVIKGNETIPEYGGGLCQISTTLFRAALESGLEITERRNHSYRVSYYEPAGTDAAVYPPHPDLRFINDTEDHILIQYRIEGAQLYFDFWGTDDGREVEITDPVIYNLVNPAPTKIVESPDLAPGERKCTERAHVGADTHFDYTITYADGETRERRFYSHYVPWREVCLVGPEPETTDPEEEEEEEEEELGEEDNGTGPNNEPDDSPNEEEGGSGDVEEETAEEVEVENEIEEPKNDNND